MSRCALIALILLAVTAFAFAQQMPGRWDKGQFSDEYKQFPGQHKNNCEQKDAEIARLKALVDQQNKKILLLEQKVNLLETELKKSKEATK